MNAVFLDTVGLIALWDQADQCHVHAESAFRQLESARRSYISTTFVLLECGNASSRRPYRSDVIRTKNALDDGNSLIEPTPLDWDIAWREYAQGHPGDPGIVDCISFAVMRRLGIQEVFSNDRHFEVAGFKILF
jgi:predicted nucleic acid-binding protein